jgi:hypothetical protein
VSKWGPVFEQAVGEAQEIFHRLRRGAAGGLTLKDFKRALHLLGGGHGVGVGEAAGGPASSASAAEALASGDGGGGRFERRFDSRFHLPRRSHPVNPVFGSCLTPHDPILTLFLIPTWFVGGSS